MALAPPHPPDDRHTAYGRIPAERREHRRHTLDHRNLLVERIDPEDGRVTTLGRLLDLSAGGVRVRTHHADVATPDARVRVRLRLPSYAGIRPFIRQRDAQHGGPVAACEWEGWMSVVRVEQTQAAVNDDPTPHVPHWHIAGRLEAMDRLDRGMLGLYLSTQPLAA